MNKLEFQAHHVLEIICMLIISSITNLESFSGPELLIDPHVLET